MINSVSEGMHFLIFTVLCIISIFTVYLIADNRYDIIMSMEASAGKVIATMIYTFVIILIFLQYVSHME